jgi:hypothetical protein
MYEKYNPVLMKMISMLGPILPQNIKSSATPRLANGLLLFQRAHPFYRPFTHTNPFKYAPSGKCKLTG